MFAPSLTRTVFLHSPKMPHEAPGFSQMVPVAGAQSRPAGTEPPSPPSGLQYTAFAGTGSPLGEAGLASQLWNQPNPSPTSPTIARRTTTAAAIRYLRFVDAVGSCMCPHLLRPLDRPHVEEESCSSAGGFTRRPAWPPNAQPGVNSILKGPRSRRGAPTPDETDNMVLEIQ